MARVFEPKLAVLVATRLIVTYFGKSRRLLTGGANGRYRRRSVHHGMTQIAE